MQDKSTMSIYRKFKHTIRDEQDMYVLEEVYVLPHFLYLK